MTLQTGIAIAELVGVVLLIAALNNSKKFLKNLIKIGVGVGAATIIYQNRDKIAETIEKQKKKVVPSMRWA